MALRHAILATLLDFDASGYQLSKAFDVSVSNYWAASPAQIYAELTRLEAQGLIEGRTVEQTARPNKRVFRLTAAGSEELDAFVSGPARPTVVRDELMVKVQAAEAGDAESLARQLDERATQATAKVAVFTNILAALRGDRDEATYLAESERIGPYLACLRGVSFETENATSCAWAAQVLRARLAGTPVPARPGATPSTSEPPVSEAPAAPPSARA